MNRHLAKELRPLLLPWGIAAFAGLGHLLPTFGAGLVNHDIVSFLVGLSGTAFVVGVLVLTALPLGLELQERTLPLLMSQPMDRSRLWRDKIVAATLAVISLGIVHLIARASSSEITSDEITVWAAFIVTAICSVGFYAVASGSLFVGVAAAAVVPWGIIAASYLIVTYVLRIENKLTERQGGMVAIGFFVVYSIVFLFLSRRQFCRLELRDRAQRGAQIPSALVPTRLVALNRSRPTGAIANLIRKEISLQKPIFLVSALFTVLWVVIVALMLVRPSYQNALEDVLNALTGIQVILMAFLTGCVALGDDKSLGTTAWHLTLPISSRTQWAIKLLVSFATLIAMAVVLPGLLALVTSPLAQVGILAAKREPAIVFAAVSSFFFVTSFWAASLSRNAIRAALTSLATLVAIGSFASFASWLMQVNSPDGWQQNVAARLVGRFQIPLGDGLMLDLYGFIVFAAAIITLALIQTATLFRQPQPRKLQRFVHCSVLALALFIGTGWFSDFCVSLQHVSNRFHAELGSAICSHPDFAERWTTSEPWNLNSTDLAQSPHLSPSVKAWIKGSNVTVTFTPANAYAEISHSGGEPDQIDLQPYIGGTLRDSKRKAAAHRN